MYIYIYNTSLWLKYLFCGERLKYLFWGPYDPTRPRFHEKASKNTDKCKISTKRARFVTMRQRRQTIVKTKVLSSSVTLLVDHQRHKSTIIAERCAIFSEIRPTILYNIYHKSTIIAERRAIFSDIRPTLLSKTYQKLRVRRFRRI